MNKKEILKSDYLNYRLDKVSYFKKQMRDLRKLTGTTQRDIERKLKSSGISRIELDTGERANFGIFKLIDYVTALGYEVHFSFTKLEEGRKN